MPIVLVILRLFTVAELSATFAWLVSTTDRFAEYLVVHHNQTKSPDRFILRYSQTAIGSASSNGKINPCKPTATTTVWTIISDYLFGTIVAKLRASTTTRWA